MNKLDTAAPHCGISGRTRLLVLLFLMTCAVIAQWFVSIDNPWRHSLYGHIDSAMFFMAGKAWANGMIPYVDFSDSKGPVLWLINMIAYWISPTNYAGVMVMSMIFLGFSLYFAWLTACRIIGDKLLALWATAPMIFMWLWAFGHSETRAETYAQLPMMYLYYNLITAFLESEFLNTKVAVCNGLALGFLLLLKWSFIIFGFLFIIPLLYVLYKKEENPVKYLTYNFIGVVIIVLPFLLYFSLVGGLGSFISEYFLETAKTVVNVSTESNRFISVIEILSKDKLNLGIIALIFFGNFAAFLHLSRFKYIPGIISIIFVGILISTSLFYYYLQLMIFMTIGFFAFCCQKVKFIMSLNPLASLISSIVLILLCLRIIIFFLNVKVLHSKDRIDPQKESLYQQAQNKLTSWSISHNKKQPKILYYDFLDCGLGVNVESLPADKYWFKQSGATPDMLQSLHNTVRKRTADFIVIQLTDSIPYQTWGYKRILTSQTTSIDPNFNKLFYLLQKIE